MAADPDSHANLGPIPGGNECSQPIATRVLTTDSERPDAAILDAAANILSRGGTVAFATETVYGLGAIATSPDSVARIFAAKGRPAINPLIVHVDGIAQAREIVADWPAFAERLARRFWPGPLTFVLPRADCIPAIVTAGKSTVAIRVPSGRVALGLIERLGQPIAAPSANRSNRLSPTRIEHVLADLDGRIDLVIDSGPTTIGLESTVIDLTTDPPCLLRPGPITRQDLVDALGGSLVTDRRAGEGSDTPSSPGQMAVHYAPRTRFARVESSNDLARIDDWNRIALVVMGQVSDLHVPAAGAKFFLDSPEFAARLLYDVLHRCDSLGVESIVVLMPPDRPEWQAVRDRLLRATVPIAS